jgi:TPR repeat protein
MTTEEHVATGIKHHEHGDLRQGSYHWQHAAFKGDPTGMLLYGLAVRHGWGVGKNPEEAVQWLRKAMESTVAADGSLLQEYRDNNTKRSQAGLAFYELGMSYLHSWGIEKDEAMALKSFEMAAELDDVDGLCEAAALYMHSGKGRKKDLMRAAALYRRAGELGASMVGQSWIYKDKYMKEHKDKKHKN